MDRDDSVPVFACALCGLILPSRLLLVCRGKKALDPWREREFLGSSVLGLAFIRNDLEHDAAVSFLSFSAAPGLLVTLRFGVANGH